ncbi:hypothetical protein [Aeromonas cavernicola]|nr:hypothetical protein [Aeromonas cavernicola]
MIFLFLMWQIIDRLMQLKYIFSFLFAVDTVFASDFCEELKLKAKTEEVHLEPNHDILKIISKGRVYLNNAPSNKYKIESDFLVTGDQFIGYSEYEKFIFVAYFKSNGDSIDGWINSSQLKNTSLTNGPSGEEQMVFNIMPDIIKENKLSLLPSKCLKYELDSRDKTFYSIKVMNLKNRECDDKINHPFDIIVRKGGGEMYTNQGAKKDEYRRIKGK